MGGTRPAGTLRTSQWQEPLTVPRKHGILTVIGRLGDLGGVARLAALARMPQAPGAGGVPTRWRWSPKWLTPPLRLASPLPRAEWPLWTARVPIRVPKREAPPARPATALISRNGMRRKTAKGARAASRKILPGEQGGQALAVRRRRERPRTQEQDEGEHELADAEHEEGLGAALERAVGPGPRPTPGRLGG